MLGGDLVREGRRRAGISQAELASRAGTTQSAIARLEGNKGSPSWDHVVRLLRLAGFEPDLRLAPQADDWQLAAQNLGLSPGERIERLTTMVEFIWAGREAMAKARHGK